MVPCGYVYVEAYFFPYTVGKIFYGRKSPKLFSRSRKFNSQKSPVSIKNALSAKKPQRSDNLAVSGQENLDLKCWENCNSLCIPKYS